MFKYDIGVIGACGHVGLPLSLVFANEGKQVLGFDINKQSIALLNQHKMPFLEQNAQELLDKTINKTFFLTTDHTLISECESLIIVIGTPVDKDFNIDLSHLEKLLKESLPYFKKDQLIILRSTIAPKTTDYVKNLIESRTSFKVGKDIFLTNIPERLTQNNAIKELKEIPQIVGSYDDSSFEKASKLFSILQPNILRLTPLEAELAKLFANSYRAATFALANEYFIISETLGVNFYNIREAVNHQYPRAGIPKAGFTKGPCLGKDSWILLNSVPHFNLSTTMVSAAYKINDGLPSFVLHKVKEKTKLDNKKIAVLGLTFKKDSDDTRDSLSLKLVNLLRNEFANYVTHDPYVDNKDLNQILPDSDIVILATNHSDYEKFDFKNTLKKDAQIVDLWNVLGKNKFIFESSEL